MGAYEVHELSGGVGVDGQYSHCGHAMSRLQIPARISDILSEFRQQFRQNARCQVITIRLRPIPVTYPPIHYSLSILPLDATQYGPQNESYTNT